MDEFSDLRLEILRGARLASTSFTFSHSFVTPRFRDKHAKIEEVCRNSENWDNAAVLTGQKVDYCLHKRIADFNSYFYRLRITQLCVRSLQGK